MKTSVIIAIYNKTDYLGLVLQGLARQSVNDFEVILADDGSSEDSVKTITEMIREYDFPVLHIWQEDKGFRKNRALNRAVTAAAGEYLVFIDGDCVPHKHFVKEHIDNAQQRTCLTGRRVNLSEKITAKLTPENVRDGFLEEKFGKIIVDGIFGKSYDVEKGIYLKEGFLRKQLNKKYRGILGCNFSLYKDELIAINGFDERYEAPSIGEDSDIEFRLALNGVKVKSLNNAAVQYHLHHKLQERKQVNIDLFEKVKAEKEAYTLYGIKQG